MSTGNNFQPLIASVARRYGIPVSLFSRLVRQESGFNPRARSGAGALGLTQLMPATARGLGVSNPYDPQQNLEGGAKYLRQQYGRFGNWREALAAYNAGPGAVQKYGGVPPFSETQRYVAAVLGGAGSLGKPARISQPGGGGGLDLATGPGLASPATPAGSARRQAALSFILGPDFTDLLSMGGPDMAGGVGAIGAVSPPKALRLPKQLPVRGKAPQGAQGLVALAKSFVGTPYSWGGGGPSGPSKGFGRGANTVGFDCSSFLQFLAAKEGVKIPRTTYDQWRAGVPVPGNKLRVGDAVFFEMGRGGPGHVGMYIGNGKFIESPRTGLSIRVSRLAGRSDFVGARRLF